MLLNNLNNLPPGGWLYEQPGTGMKFREMGPFLDCAKLMVLHRRANNLERATMEAAVEDLQLYTCQRLGDDPQWCQKKTTFNTVSPTPNPSPAKPAGALSSFKQGAEILYDWLGQGGIPVNDHVAEMRSKVCVDKCSDPDKGFNKEPKFLPGLAAHVANAIHEQLREKHNLGLRVANEDDLHSCAVCNCNLKLKVWTPLAIILGRTPPEQLEKFPSYCWLKTEQPQIT